MTAAVLEQGVVGQEVHKTTLHKNFNYDASYKNLPSVISSKWTVLGLLPLSVWQNVQEKKEIRRIGGGGVTLEHITVGILGDCFFTSVLINM